MHRLVTHARPGQLVDHINGNKLDNRRENLRLATSASDQWNRRRQRSALSRFKGVSFGGTSKKWRVELCANKCRVHLGSFDTQLAAALAYDRAAKEHFGSFARLNFPSP